MRASRADTAFNIANYFILSVILIIVIYPLYFMLIASISNPDYVNSGQVWLYPQGITLEGYGRILQDNRIWQGYGNTLLYTIFGTALNTALVLTAGYSLSRKDLVGRNAIMMLFVFTMFFQGGLIPTYLLVKSLGLVNTFGAMVFPNAVSVFQLIIVRTFFQSTIPDELLEAGMMDGCTNKRFFASIALPLSLPIVAVIVLFNAVMHWNAYFNALIYLRDARLFPLQLILRDILISNQQQAAMLGDLDTMVEQQRIAELIKYGVVIVASVPVLLLYPFLQRYFVKGVMIGSVKG